jgi:nucleoside-diphosphate-sugar epimerase
MKATRGASYVFHLAATVGGIHYILKENVRGLTPSLLMNTDMLEAARKCDVERFLFASSACVYREKDLRLNRFREEDAYPANPLTTYGWTKLMGEIQCKAYFLDYGIRASALRIFNAYGENETHAIIALIAKALLKMEPYVIWGSGNQSRNFTYVDDIVDAIVKAAEKIDDGSAVNAGRDDSVTIDQAAELVFDIVGWRPREINHDLSKPQGVASRAADLSRAKEVLVWSPKVSYEEGFRRTIEWYFARKKPDHVRADLDRLLMER